MARYIDPLDDLKGLLLTVEKPARYTGGEYGMLAKRDAAFQTVIAFPDLYEIGMSNQALRILYNRLNALSDISCDRVFAPAPDFETLLRENGIPLYALDTGIALCDCDMLMFTLGYELGITSVLAMLDAAGIPLLREARGDESPVVIAGGPCVSNPMPYSRFIDAFWIGEAEDEFFTLVRQLCAAKAGGAVRGELLGLLARHPSVWVAGKKKAVRAVDAGFSMRKGPAPVFPVPSMRITQHHGVVEIMRGCPNGCRFCHAGIWYRPMRQKDGEAVVSEAADCIFKAGFREISLSSLSSGDYRNIENLIGALDAKFGGMRVSFQLPSLHVSTFSLPLLEKISRVRKSGLTFAVETPLADWQAALN
ncbi:MAG: radical SAM protein, partial [Spirochaetaceae bacterium]|nr:radical SAM protein [Spirochaetaceae bacterium]